MTGHGDASGQNDRISVTAEVRSVNNRHLKVTVRCPDAFLSLEAHIDRLVRQTISRGTLTVHLHIRQLGDCTALQINANLMRAYYSQLRELADALGTEPPRTLSEFLALPGIVDDRDRRSVEESDWPFLEGILSAALANLQQFRREEGEVMRSELLSLCSVLEENAAEIQTRAPQVAVDYRERLLARIQLLLNESSVKVDDHDLIREVSLFADRCDITEELTRLRSHLQQYRTLLASDGANGRKLEFLGQELYREVNTVGSKANDIAISHRVVEMKAAVEKMREIIQNVE